MFKQQHSLVVARVSSLGLKCFITEVFLIIAAVRLHGMSVIEASRAPLTLMTDTVNNLEKGMNYRLYRGYKPVACEN